MTRSRGSGVSARSQSSASSVCFRLRRARQGESMKALVLSEYKKLDVVDMQKPQPCEDELLICVQACGICGSDVHGYDGSTGRRLPPIVMEHEAAGIVETIGGAVTDFHP